MTCSLCQQSGHNKRTCPRVTQVATTGKYAGLNAIQIEAIFAERERKNYEELVAPIIAAASAFIPPKSACADCGQIETECRLERVGEKIMCCDCIDPKPTEYEEEEEEEEVSVCEECGVPETDECRPDCAYQARRQKEEEEESVCDDEQRSYGDRGAPAPESDDEEEVGECSNCDAPLDDDEHIFIFTRGDEEKTMCQMCGEDLHEELNADGWRRDDEEDKEEANLPFKNPKPTCDDCGGAIRDPENLDTCWTNDGIIYWCEYCREEYVEEYIRERDGDD